MHGPLDLTGVSFQEDRSDLPFAIWKDLEDPSQWPRPGWLIVELDRHQGSDFQIVSDSGPAGSSMKLM